MTHEHRPGAEADDGPEHDTTLPPADSIPVADGPEELEPAVWPGEWD